MQLSRRFGATPYPARHDVVPELLNPPSFNTAQSVGSGLISNMETTKPLPQEKFVVSMPLTASSDPCSLHRPWVEPRALAELGYEVSV